MIIVPLIIWGFDPPYSISDSLPVFPFQSRIGIPGMPEEFPHVLALISLSERPLPCLLWKHKRNHHFRVNDSSLSFLFWCLLMAADISATAQRGENGNPDLPTQGNFFQAMQGSSLLPVTQTRHLHVTANSFPPIQYLAKPWSSLLLSFRHGFQSIHALRIHITTHLCHCNPINAVQRNSSLLHLIDQSSSCTESSPHTFPSYSPLS